MDDAPQKLSPLAEFLLTKHLPCAALAFAMLSSVVWLPGLFMSMPPLAILMSFVAIVLHAFTPALFGVIAMGGGARYALQVAGLLGLMVLFTSSMNVLLAVVVVALYAALPIWASQKLRLVQGGLAASARGLLFSLCGGVLIGLMLMAQSQGLSLHAEIDAMLEPVFASMPHDAGTLPEEGIAQLHKLLSWSLPGLLIFGIWSVWWSTLLYARGFAMRYGFYDGDVSSVLKLNFGRYVAYLLLVSLLLANIGSGSVQYIAVSVALVLAGVMGIQGVSVAHVWLKVRDMPMAIAMMYVLLFIWSMMVVPFIILGLLDIWYDYRRGLDPTSGGK